jgi:hypothetical protein
MKFKKTAIGALITAILVGAIGARLCIEVANRL